MENKPVKQNNLPMVPFTSSLEQRTRDACGELDPGQLKALQEYAAHPSALVYYSLAMVCKGSNCPIYSLCPIKKSGIKVPEGESCPVELSILDDAVNYYCDYLEIDTTTPSGKVDLSLILEIARSELIEFRIDCRLALNPDPVRSQVKTVSVTGDTYEEEIPKAELDILERWSRMKIKIRQELLATRRAQVQAGAQLMDASKKSADLMERAQKAKEKAEKQRREMEERGFVVD